jgi:hypothetical protein
VHEQKRSNNNSSTMTFSLLGQGYTLDDLVNAAEETRKIRASRRANMKGTWDKFRSMYESALRKKAPTGKKFIPNVVVSKAC